MIRIGFCGGVCLITIIVYYAWLRGVGQLAGALGELAGASSMAATSCGNVTDEDDYDYEMLGSKPQNPTP